MLDKQAKIMKTIANQLKLGTLLLTLALPLTASAQTNDAAAFYNRGNAKDAKGDYDGAITDYNKAIELKPNDADAFNTRGNAKEAKSDYDGAITDYNKAIELKPDFEEAFYNRGNAKQNKGDHDGAITDFNKAIELKPNDADAFYNRGYLRYNSQDFTNALVDFHKAVELNSYEYARFQIWLIRTRLGETKAATTELQTYLAGRTTGKPDDWASKVGHFLTGQLAEPDFLAAAKNADPKTEAGQLCEAYFYAGSKHLFASDKATAMDYFQKSIATDKKGYTEYKSAVAELKFLKAEMSNETVR
jgi:lipoprotein NlpI